MFYDQLGPKQKRIIARDVGTLFLPRALFSNPTIEDIKRMSPFHPTVKFNRRTIFLSKEGVAALRRLADIIANIPGLAEWVSEREVDDEVLKTYNRFLKKLLEPDGQEFVDAVSDTLRETIKDYEFLVEIEGIDLEDQNIIELGSTRIVRPDRSLLEKVNFGGSLDLDSIYEQFKDRLWLVGISRGGRDIASKRFERSATLTVGVLAICGAVLYRGAIWRTRVRAFISPLEHRSAISSLCWEVGGAHPSLSRHWAAEQDLPLGSDAIAHLTRECFLKQLALLGERTDRSELEDAILRSVYWFADAYRDRNRVMQFVKLWSCSESFFAIEREGGVTELNTSGIAAILTFAGFRVMDVDAYKNSKRRIKRLYSLRSQAIHRASFDHIQTSDLNDLSYWMAWLILSMVALSERGYTTLRQIRREVCRLDRLSTERLK